MKIQQIQTQQHGKQFQNLICGVAFLDGNM